MASIFRTSTLVGLRQLLSIRGPQTVTCAHLKVWSKEEGLNRDIITLLQKDYDISWKGFRKYLDKKAWKEKVEDQSFNKDRHMLLGPDLAVAHFLVYRGASVKLVGEDRWVKRSDDGSYFLPTRHVHGFLVEGIDVSNTDLMYEGLENLVDLDHLRYLNVSKCRFFDDWCLAALERFSRTLEVLNISGCQRVTERGVAALHCMENLRGLRMSDMKYVKDQELLALKLEEYLPGLQIIGVQQDPLLKLDSQTNVKQISEHETSSSVLSSSSVDRDAVKKSDSLTIDSSCRKSEPSGGTEVTKESDNSAPLLERRGSV